MTPADVLYMFSRGVLMGFLAFCFCLAAFALRSGHLLYGFTVGVVSLSLYWRVLKQVFAYLKERLDDERGE